MPLPENPIHTPISQHMGAAPNGQTREKKPFGSPPTNGAAPWPKDQFDVNRPLSPPTLGCPRHTGATPTRLY